MLSHVGCARCGVYGGIVRTDRAAACVMAAALLWASADTVARAQQPAGDAGAADTGVAAPTDTPQQPSEPALGVTAPVEPEAAPEPAPVGHASSAAVSTVALERGGRVYRRYCESCHGRLGDGLGPAARFLRVPPRNFMTGVYKWRTTESGALPTDADLIRTVRRGAPGTPMPAWEGRLSMADIYSVVQYIKTFSADFADQPRPTRLPMPTSVPRFDAPMVERGRMMYVLLQCWTCHGMDGRGDGPAAATLVDDTGLATVAYDFTQGQMRSGTRPIDVYRTYTTGVNGTPMPSYVEAILVGRDGYTDLSAYERSLAPAEVARLRQFIARMPTTEELFARPEAEQLAWSVERRWALVAYVLSLSGRGAVVEYLLADPWVTR